MFIKRSIGSLAASAYMALVVTFLLASAPSKVDAAAAVETPVVSPSPLSVGGNVPGNLLFVPSVEFPTVDSVANLGDYSSASTYVGYFDSGKCYEYYYHATEANRHFFPTSTATGHTCSGSKEWSGNYLNWAGTQTIDPFRKALTGGLRVVDTSTETILEKARSDGSSSATYFPIRSITTETAGATPAGWGDRFHTRISRMNNKMLFTRSLGGSSDRLGDAGSNFSSTPTAYDGGSSHALTGTTDTTVYEVSMRVKVCVVSGSFALESNCVGYPKGSPTHYKPEGLIQKYSDRIRYSAFGFLNDHSVTRDGGALRAKQKFVGPYTLSFNTTNGWVESTNSAKEWDPETGILVQNPDSADATSTTDVIDDGSGYTAASHAIVNSGVINYINKFGQITSKNHKNYDPVSELYYTAIRYLKNQGNVSEYTSLSGSALNRWELADGFPVITNWNDPIQYACQNNAILGIGDVYTHRDKNLPGSGTSSSDEPTKPTAVSGDSTVNVRTATEKVFAMEGLSITTSANSWSGRENSAFIAGLAYDSHTNDLRPDAAWPALTGKQTVSTYWVDVRENQRLEDRGSNQYWLAAKYGGFKVPDTFSPYAAATTTLPAGSWESDESLMHWGGSSHNVSRTRPTNFYVASEADEMVASLTRAFANIVAESKGSASSLAANSTRLDTETRTFQAQFFSGIWGGELNAFSVGANGALSAQPVWNATDDMLTGITGTPGAWAGRTLYAGNEAGTALVNFTTGTGGLSTTQKAKFGANATLQTNVVNYLRGERTNEESYAGGTLRVRQSILGDIVNSTPLFIGAPNAVLHAGKAYAGGDSYATWAANTARVNRTPVVYVGANDGMLHAFNASTGREVFAFMPNAVIDSGIAQFASPLYEHKFFVDGETAAAEIYDTATSSWKTVLVGTLGRGGPGLFALDVTVPESPTLLWEKDAADIPVLGKNIGRPVIAQVANGDWRVLLGNGPDSGDGAYLISITLGGVANGTVSTYAADTTSTNGLTSLLVRDSDGNSYADIAYAGDLEGALWKFSGISGTPSALKLFEAVDPDGLAQPITAAPMVGRDPETANLWVFFGTGKYLNEDDIADKQVQTWYGIIDSGVAVSGRSELVDRDILVEATVGGVPARVIESGAASELAGKKGWYIDLVSPTVNPADGKRGERMVVQNRFQGQALIGTTRIPQYTDPCKPTGSGYIMAISPFTGARLSSTFFDMNGDGISNDSDKYLTDDLNGDGVKNDPGYIPLSGIGFESSPNNPIFIENIMQVGLDDGTTKAIETFGSAVEASRMSWRELFNNN